MINVKKKKICEQSCIHSMGYSMYDLVLSKFKSLTTDVSWSPWRLLDQQHIQPDQLYPSRLLNDTATKLANQFTASVM